MNKKIVYAIGSTILIGVIFFISNSVQEQKNQAAEAISLAELPAAPFPQDPESVALVVKDEKTNQEYLSNQLIVEFMSDTTEEESLRIVESAGGLMLQRFTLAPIFLIQVKDSGDGVVAKKIKSTLMQNPQVKKVEFNFLTTLQNPATP